MLYTNCSSLWDPTNCLPAKLLTAVFDVCSIKRSIHTHICARLARQRAPAPTSSGIYVVDDVASG